jgi:hypothetical protein
LVQIAHSNLHEQNHQNCRCEARLDNRWGCSVAMRSITLTRHPVATLTPAPGTLVRNGSTLDFTSMRSMAALGEIAFVREFSQSLAEGWSQVGGMVETILEETTDLQKVRVTTPAGTAGRRFVRLRVTRR